MESLMILPQQARDEFEKEATKFRQTQEVVEAQRTLLVDLTSSLPSHEAIQKELDEVNASITETDRQLLEAQELLAGVMTSHNHQDEGSAEGEELVKNLLKMFIEEVIAISSEAVNQGDFSVLITKVMHLESDVNQRIDALCKSGLYLESETEAADRVKEFQRHTAKVLSFLKQVVPMDNAQ